MHLKKIKSTAWVYLIVILILAAILRFYGLKTAGFDYDQEYAANFAYRVVNEYPIQMIGQNLSVGGLFMGPFYFYFLTPFFMATNLYPIGGVIGSIVLGLITVAVYFYVFRSVFGLKTAIIASLLRASLFSFLGDDLAMTPAFSADLPALLTWFCFYKYWHDRPKYLILLSFLFGLYTSYHPILFPFYIVFLVILGFKRKLPNWRILSFCLIVFFVPLLPLIRFEYHHDFLEVKRLFSLGSNDKGEAVNSISYSRLGWLLNTSFISPVHNFFGIYSLNFALTFGKVWGVLLYIPILVLIFLKRDFWKDCFHRIVFFSTYIIFITYYFFLPVSLTEYYLLGFSTLFFIYAVASFSQIKSKIVFPVVLILILVNLYQWYLQVNRKDGTTLFNKEQIVNHIKDNAPEGEDYFVSYIAKPGYSFGFDYLFKVNNMVPSKDPQPRTFNIVTPKSMVGDKFDYESGDIGLILPKE